MRVDYKYLSYLLRRHGKVIPTNTTRATRMTLPKNLQVQYGARNRRLASNQMTYKQYLQSPLWKNIRKQLLSFPEFKRCYCCNKGGKMQLHHKHYRDIFDEKISKHRKAIFPVCGRCHQELHDLSVENKWGLRQAARRLRKMNCIQ